MKRIAFALTALVLACSALFAQQPTTYTFTDVTYPKDTFVQLLGVNNKGTIAGYHGATTNKGFTFVLPSSFTAENYPGSAQTQVLAINNLTSPGTSGFYIDAAGTTHGFEHCAGVWIKVDFPGTTFNQVLGINNNAQGAGYYQDSTGNFHPYIYNKVGGVFEELYLPNTMSAQATAINSLGVRPVMRRSPALKSRQSPRAVRPLRPGRRFRKEIRWRAKSGPGWRVRSLR